MAAAFRAWCEIGGNPEAFWRLTPWQSFEASHGIAERERRAHRDTLSAAWLNAVLARAEKIPPLEALLGDAPEEPPVTDPEEFVAMMKRAFNG